MRIKFLRKQRGMSQEDLALSADINPRYLCELENGKRNPTLKVLNSIAQALKVSLETLFKGVTGNYLIG